MACIVALTPLVYLPSLPGGFLIDDGVLLTDSPLIKSADGLWRFWFSTDAVDYWPVSNSTLWVEWRLWDMNPLGYRATNLALHIVESLLLWRILSALAIPGAAVGALFFALHPVNVETVAWISQRKTLMAMLFAQLSTLLYLRWFQRSGGGGWYWMSLLAFALALLSKISVAVFPLQLAAMLRWLRPLSRRDVLRLLPFALLAAALVGVNVWFRARDPNIAVGADPVAAALRAAVALWFYLSKALLPLDLAFMYPLWGVRPDRLQWWLPLFAAAATTAVLIGFRHRGSAPLLFAWAMYCAALSPSLGFTEALFIEDHYQHLALPAVTASAAAGWEVWRRRSSGWMRRTAELAAVATVAALALLSARHAPHFTDNVTLMRAALAIYPHSAVAHRNLGFALLGADRPRDARAVLERAVALDPESMGARQSLAVALAALGDRDAAIGELEVALRLGGGDPETLGNLGAFLREAGRSCEALPYLERAVEMQPGSARLRRSLGTTLLELDQRERAVAQLQEAVRLEPDSNEARRLLAIARDGAAAGER